MTTTVDDRRCRRPLLEDRSAARLHYVVDLLPFRVSGQHAVSSTIHVGCSGGEGRNGTSVPVRVRCAAVFYGATSLEGWRNDSCLGRLEHWSWRKS